MSKENQRIPPPRISVFDVRSLPALKGAPSRSPLAATSANLPIGTPPPAYTAIASPLKRHTYRRNGTALAKSFIYDSPPPLDDNIQRAKSPPRREFSPLTHISPPRKANTARRPELGRPSRTVSLPSRLHFSQVTTKYRGLLATSGSRPAEDPSQVGQGRSHGITVATPIDGSRSQESNKLDHRLRDHQEIEIGSDSRVAEKITIDISKSSRQSTFHRSGVSKNDDWTPMRSSPGYPHLPTQLLGGDSDGSNDNVSPLSPPSTFRTPVDVRSRKNEQRRRPRFLSPPTSSSDFDVLYTYRKSNKRRSRSISGGVQCKQSSGKRMESPSLTTKGTRTTRRRLRVEVVIRTRKPDMRGGIGRSPNTHSQAHSNTLPKASRVRHEPVHVIDQILGDIEDPDDRVQMRHFFNLTMQQGCKGDLRDVAGNHQFCDPQILQLAQLLKRYGLTIEKWVPGYLPVAP